MTKMNFFGPEQQAALTENDIYRICGSLPLKSILDLCETNKAFHDVLHKKIELFSPILENYSDKDLKSRTTWCHLSFSHGMKTFYLSAKELFQANQRANGCYKLELSWIDILKLGYSRQQASDSAKSKPSILPQALEDKKYSWRQLMVPVNFIKSYIRKSPRIEIINSFATVDTSNEFTPGRSRSF